MDTEFPRYLNTAFYNASMEPMNHDVTTKCIPRKIVA